jgi:AcrR family transcriptional regulator
MGKTNETWGPRKRPVQRRSQETVGYILEAAAQLFGELGYGRTTTNRVAEKAGVSIGSVYQYFPNKEALLLALAESHLAEAREKATAALRGQREQGVSEKEYFRGFVGFVVGFHRGGEPLHDLFFEEAPSSGRLVELLSAVHAGCAAEIEAYLRGRGLNGGDLALKSMVLARMAGDLTHSFVTDTPAGHALVAYQEEIVTACLAYVRASWGGNGAGGEPG